MKKRPSTILAAAGFLAAAIVLDQWTKALAVRYLAGGRVISLIPGVLELRYLENQGAAFGMLQQQQTFFIILTVLVLSGMAWLYLFRIPEDRKFRPLNLVLLSVAGGAAGNFIDRLYHHYVVDFIYVRLIDFPIFNVADCFVSVGAACLFVLILFFYKEEDLKGIL